MYGCLPVCLLCCSTQRVGHMLVRLQSRSVGIGYTFTLLSTVLLWFSGTEYCSSYLQARLLHSPPFIHCYCSAEDSG